MGSNDSMENSCEEGCQCNIEDSNLVKDLIRSNLNLNMKRMRWT